MKGHLKKVTHSFKKALYPTWFRWKCVKQLFFAPIVILYIPHGSDERCVKQLFFAPIVILYIPHGSDESSSKSSAIRIFKRLYIPHGSDESGIRVNHKDSFYDFISHMVQMKVFVIPIFLNWSKLLYIPHGSDERDTSKTLPYAALRALYPTWFRWKPVPTLAFRWRYNFISHMVQMKA